MIAAAAASAAAAGVNQHLRLLHRNTSNYFIAAATNDETMRQITYILLPHLLCVDDDVRAAAVEHVHGGDEVVVDAD